MLVSVFSLMAVSYDRFIAISFPFRMRIDRKMSRWIIAIIWIASTAIASPIIPYRSYKVHCAYYPLSRLEIVNINHELILNRNDSGKTFWNVGARKIETLATLTT